MVPQQAQRLRWEDDVDTFLWCDKGRVFDDDELILFYLFLPQLWRMHIHPFPFLHSFASSFATTVHFTDARRLFLDGLIFRLFCMLARLVPLHAIKPLNTWVRLGQCSLAIAKLDSIRSTMEFQLIDRNFWMFFLPLKNA